jgi:hypothetical protein
MITGGQAKFELEFSRLQDIADVAFEQARVRAEAEDEPCPHDELEGWGEPCGTTDYGCQAFGPPFTWACIACGAVRQPDGTFLV